MATARPVRRLFAPGPTTIRNNNVARVSAMRLGALVNFIELRLDEAEMDGTAEAMCEECPAQGDDCILGCARNLLQWLREGVSA